MNALIDSINRLRFKQRNHQAGSFYLEQAKEFSKKIQGDIDSFDRGLVTAIKKGEFPGKLYQEILAAFMPDYEKDLFRFYQNQQFFILFRFLQYPFRYGLDAYVKPYERGLSLLSGKARVLEYGCGVPYGLIETLRKGKSNIEAICLVDLDLLHMDFTEHLIRRLAPSIPLEVHRLRNTEEIFEVSNSYNFFFGKDIFEHLYDPEEKLRGLMAKACDEAICYFDFRDHGEKMHQHVSPNIGHLSIKMEELGFKKRGLIKVTTEFSRGIS